MKAPLLMKKVVQLQHMKVVVAAVVAAAVVAAAVVAAVAVVVAVAVEVAVVEVHQLILIQL